MVLYIMETHWNAIFMGLYVISTCLEAISHGIAGHANMQGGMVFEAISTCCEAIRMGLNAISTCLEAI